MFKILRYTPKTKIYNFFLAVLNARKQNTNMWSRIVNKTSFILKNVGEKQQHRCMSNLKAIAMRLKSVKNIKKITQSMKMVSAAKYSRAERELRAVKPIGDGARKFYDKNEIAPVPEIPQKLIIVMTSDRGLCGACHTNVARQVRARLDKDYKNIKIVCVGDKSRIILRRSHSKNIFLTCNEVGRIPPTFADAAKLADAILRSSFEFGSGEIIYNHFKNVVSYSTQSLPVFSVASVMAAPKLAAYDSLDEETVRCYLEFSLAAMLYYAMKEAACSEQSARMTAMDNASKNAAKMIQKLSLTYNRTRQAVITNELIEIISGAAAL